MFLLLDGMVVSAPAIAAQNQATGWQKVPTSGAFFSRLLTPIVYDSAHARFLFFGGAGGEVDSDTVFFYPNNDTFLSKYATVHPSPRYASTLSFDVACGCAVLFGGAYKQNGIETVHNDTWLYFSSNESWTKVTNGVAPTARHLDAMVYDPVSRTDLLFGGTDGLFYNDLWSFSAARHSWSLLENFTGLHRYAPMPNITGRPPSRFAFGMASMNTPDSFLVFGGVGVNTISMQYIVYNDTWTYSSSRQGWANITSGIHPPGRTFAAMASSPEYGLTLLFGGSAGADPFITSKYLSDTWVFDQNTGTWYELNVTGPPSLFGASLGYDPMSKSFLLFGGEAVGGTSSTVWRLNVSVILSLIGSMATTTTTSTATKTMTVPTTTTGPTSTTTATQTLTSTTTQSSSSVPTWAYVTMVVLLVVGFAMGYILKRPSITKRA